MNVAFGYIRRSSYKQQENNSVEIQKSHILEYAKRKGFNMPNEFIFVEDVTSAYSKRAGQRKELMRMLELMIETNTSRVIFYEESRMDRTGYSFVLDFYRPLVQKMNNAEVYTTNSESPFDPDDRQKQVLLLIHRQESEIKSNRAIGSLISDLENEHIIRPGSKVPYGYDQKDKRLIPNKDADIVTFIYFLQSWGVSMAKIASILNEASIPSPQGKQWRTSSIESILKNPVYTGSLLWNIKKGTTKKPYKFEDSHEPIIDRFLIHLINNNIKLQNKYGRLDTPFLFLNKLQCSMCNNKLCTQNGSTTRKGKKYYYQDYVCKNCNYKLGLNQVHAFLLPKVLNYVQNLLDNGTTKLSTINELNEIDKSISETVGNLKSRVDKLLSKGSIAREHDDREYEKMVEKLCSQHIYSLESFEQSQTIVQDLLETVQSDMFFNRFNQILNLQLAKNEKRLIILYFIDVILVSPDRLPKVIYNENVFDAFELKPPGYTIET